MTTIEKISYTPTTGKLTGVTLTGGVPCTMGEHGQCVRFSGPQVAICRVSDHPRLWTEITRYEREYRPLARREPCSRCGTYCEGDCQASRE